MIQCANNCHCVLQLCQCVNGFCLCAAQTLIIFEIRIHKIQFVCLILRVLCTFLCSKFIDHSSGQSSLALVHTDERPSSRQTKNQLNIHICFNSSQQISHIQRYKTRKKNNKLVLKTVTTPIYGNAILPRNIIY